MKTAAFLTLGCKVNQYETQAFREEVLAAGHREVSSRAPADLYVVNTCVVTHAAERESRKVVRRLHRQNPNARIVVTGCYAEKDPEGAARLPGVAEVVGNRDKGDTAARALGFGERKRMREAAAARSGRALPLAPDEDGWGAGAERDEAEAPGGASSGAGAGASAGSPPDRTPAVFGRSSLELLVSRFGDRTRAFVKVEDGCNLCCSFCIIPRVRGEVRSRAPEDIVAEARRLAVNGWREIVLTGIHLGHYGRGKGERESLADLLPRLADVPGIERIRLSSIEAAELTDRLLAALASSEKLCPSLHVPLQSGSDATLRRMRRRGTAARFLARIEAARRALARPAFATDVIAGFPGETERDFEETVRVCREAGFMRLHVFPYSDRDGTEASGLDAKCSPRTIAARRRRLLALGEELADSFALTFVGERVPLLVEHERDRATGLLQGYSDRYVRVLFEGSDDVCGRIVPIVVQSVAGGEARGRIASGAQTGGGSATVRPRREPATSGARDH